MKNIKTIERLMAAGSYLLGFITAPIFLVLGMRSEFVLFHALQSFFFFGGVFILNIFLGFIPLVGWLIGLLSSLVSFILWIVLMYKTLKGDRYKVPFVGGFAEKLVNEMNGHYASLLIRWLALAIDGLWLIIPNILMQGIISLMPLKGDQALLRNSLAFLIVFLYNTIFLKRSGATPGKKYLGLQVVQIDGTPLTWKTIILRETVGKLLSGFVLGLGYIWVLFDKKHQAWHDKIAGTYVIKK